MLLYVVRHGIAVDIGQNGVQRDEDRMLTAIGKSRMTTIARGLKALRCEPDLVASSPLVRARETAGILANELTADGKVAISDELGPHGTLAGTVRWLRSLGHNSIMLVGHMPGVAELTADLIGGNHDTDIHFKKAGVACVSCEGKPIAGAGTLEWLLQPKALRRLGEANG